MNILMIHPHDLYSAQEPWTVRIVNIAKEFSKKGHSVKLVYFPLDHKNACKSPLSANIEIISMDRRLGIFVLLRNIINMIKLAQWADLIHFQKCYYYAALPALIAGLIKNKPVHYDWDDWETKIFYYSNPKHVVVGEFLNIFEKLVPMAADTVSVSSKRLNCLCRQRGVPAENIFFAPVGADLEKFRPNLNLSAEVKRKYNIKGHMVMYVGQLHGGQYAELFIKAAPIVRNSGLDAVFMIVGDGYRLGELKRLAESLGVSGNFIFTGSVPHYKVPYYISEADVCVACFDENDITMCKSPLKIVEYLASGKAIVASRVGEVRNMVGAAGILVEPNDAVSLANGIVTFLRNDYLRQKAGAQARLRAERKYNWRQTAQNLLGAYEKAVNLRNKS